jgi:hypothetical protein
MSSAVESFHADAGPDGAGDDGACGMRAMSQLYMITSEHRRNYEEYFATSPYYDRTSGISALWVLVLCCLCGV